MSKEFLVTAIRNKKSVATICRELGCSKRAVYDAISRFRIKLQTTILRPGRRFGKLRIVKHVGSSGHDRLYECRCDCGNVCRVKRGNLNRKQTCGCSRLRRGKEHPEFTGVGELSGRHWSAIRLRAKRKQRSFTITLQYAWRLFVSQGGVCVLSGMPISLTAKPRTASLDRIDSRRGYVRGNVQWVHSDVNRMKQEFAENYFVEMCRRVTAAHTK